MADLNMARNPLSQEVFLILNEVHRDHYQDAIVTQEARIKKRAIVKKSEDMNYVQMDIEPLLEDTENPWIISVTRTDLPRQPRMDDQISIDGIKYSIAMVKPANRDIDAMLLLFVYPERDPQPEDLSILDIVPIYKKSDATKLTGYSLIYEGLPIQYAFGYEDTPWNSLTWRSFKSSFFKDPSPATFLYLKGNSIHGMEQVIKRALVL